MHGNLENQKKRDNLKNVDIAEGTKRTGAKTT